MTSPMLDSMLRFIPGRPGAPPTLAQVGRRLLILQAQLQRVHAAPPAGWLRARQEGWPAEARAEFQAASRRKRDEFVASLRSAGLWDEMSRAERALLQAAVGEETDRQRIDGSWLAEAAVCVAWALSLAELPGWDQEADPGALLALAPGNLAAARLRPPGELERLRSLAELWHWRSRTRQLQEDGYAPRPGQPGLDEIVRLTAEMAASRGDVPCADGDLLVRGRPYRELDAAEWGRMASIALERHRALNWLCGHAPGNDWERTPTGT